MSFATITISQLLEFQEQTILRHGGSPGIRDRGLIERVILEVASGAIPRQQFTEWVKLHTQPLHPANGTQNNITHGP